MAPTSTPRTPTLGRVSSRSIPSQPPAQGGLGVGTSDVQQNEPGSDFEKVLRAHFTSYERLEAQARRAGVDTKPFVARWVAERIRDEESEGKKKLAEIVEKIFGLLYPDP